MMEALDCDKNILQDSFGQRAVRDIVQFVKFADFKDNAETLAAEVLKEFPEQFLSYMKYMNIMPSGF